MRWVAALVLLLPVTGCGGDEGTRLRVLAAASLAASFEELATAFEADHPGIEVQLSVGGSADLVAQVREGAPADVLATADTATMARVVDADLVAEEPAVFATNVLAVAVPAGNPAGVTGLTDLAAGSDLDLVVCAPEVPCGAVAARVAQAAGIRLDPASEEQSVTDVLGKVLSGEADAGLVYATDLLSAAGDVEGVPLPPGAATTTDYPIAVLADAEEPDLARAFVDLVRSTVGEQVLAESGFRSPAP